MEKYAIIYGTGKLIAGKPSKPTEFTLRVCKTDSLDEEVRREICLWENNGKGFCHKIAHRKLIPLTSIWEYLKEISERYKCTYIPSTNSDRGEIFFIEEQKPEVDRLIREQGFLINGLF